MDSSLDIEQPELLQAVSHSDDRYRHLFDLTSDFAFEVHLDESGSLVLDWISDGFSHRFGYQPGELGEFGVFTVVHPDDLPVALDSMRRHVDGVERAEVEIRLRTRDGEDRWVRFYSRAVRHPEAGTLRIVGAGQDVTERVRTETELRESLELLRRTDEERRRLLARLVTAQDEERERIALEIHDDPIQVMTAVSMRLEVLRRGLTDRAQRETCAQLQELVSGCIASLRELILQVHPPALDQYGFVPAFARLLEQTRRQSGLAFTLRNGLAEEPSAPVRIVLYRIAEEALRNVVKHARASTVGATLEPRDSGFLVRLADDGAGFFPQEARPVPGHLGIAAMRERAEISGGWFRLRSAPGEGTTVEFWLPAEPEASESAAEAGAGS